MVEGIDNNVLTCYTKDHTKDINLIRKHLGSFLYGFEEDSIVKLFHNEIHLTLGKANLGEDPNVFDVVENCKIKRYSDSE